MLSYAKTRIIKVCKDCTYATFTTDRCSRLQDPGRATCIRKQVDTRHRDDNVVAMPIQDTCRRRQGIQVDTIVSGLHVFGVNAALVITSFGRKNPCITSIIIIIFIIIFCIIIIIIITINISIELQLPQLLRATASGW